MKSISIYHMDSENPDPNAPDFTALEGALRDACTRAMIPTLPLAVMLKLYRSVAAVARALMRARVDAGLPRGLDEDLVAMLDAVRDAVCRLLPDPEMPTVDAILVYRAIVALSLAAHRARDSARATAASDAAPLSSRRDAPSAAAREQRKPLPVPAGAPEPGRPAGAWGGDPIPGQRRDERNDPRFARAA
jgi:hypothetical protein